MSALSTREQLAEALSWSSGEMTRWSEDAVPDHNRWSWRGDGHDAAFRQQFWDQADALLGAGVSVLLVSRDALAKALAVADPEGFGEDNEVFYAEYADALLAAGVFVDAGKLAEDDALVEAAARGLAQMEPREEWDAVTPSDDEYRDNMRDQAVDALRAVAAVLASPQSERAEVES